MTTISKTGTPAANVSWPDSVIIYTDGASRGNPGPASIGVFVTDLDSQAVLEYGEPLGIQTNNVAEYTGVLRALQMALDHGARRVRLRSDSELMIKQMTGVYKVKSPGLQPLFQECSALAKKLESVQFEHVRREFNTVADRLANEALDQRARRS